jgi:hypothetical protein
VGRTTTVTDPYGDTKTTVTDVNGWLRHAKDAQTPTLIVAFVISFGYFLIMVGVLLALHKLPRT